MLVAGSPCTTGPLYYTHAGRFLYPADVAACFSQLSGPILPMTVGVHCFCKGIASGTVVCMGVV